MLSSDAAGAPRGGLSHSVGDRRTLPNSCDSPTRCATAGERCGANGDPLVRAQRKRDDTRATQRHTDAERVTTRLRTRPVSHSPIPLVRRAATSTGSMRCGRPPVRHPDADPGRLDALPDRAQRHVLSRRDRAGCAAGRGPGDVALVQTLGVGLLLVQEAIGESVLAVEARGHTDLAEHRASHHGILVVAEQLPLHVLDLLHQPLRRLAQDGRSSLCGIPQPLGCLGCL